MSQPEQPNRPSSNEARLALIGALTLIWEDSFRRDNPTFRERHFDEIVADAVNVATNRTVKIINR